MFVPDRVYHYSVMLHYSLMGLYVSYEENSVVNMAPDLKFAHVEPEPSLVLGDQCKIVATDKHSSLFYYNNQKKFYNIVYKRYYKTIFLRHRCCFKIS